MSKNLFVFIIWRSLIFQIVDVWEIWKPFSKWSLQRDCLVKKTFKLILHISCVKAFQLSTTESTMAWIFQKSVLSRILFLSNASLSIIFNGRFYELISSQYIFFHCHATRRIKHCKVYQSHLQRWRAKIALNIIPEPDSGSENNFYKTPSEQMGFLLIIC